MSQDALRKGLGLPEMLVARHVRNLLTLPIVPLRGGTVNNRTQVCDYGLLHTNMRAMPLALYLGKAATSAPILLEFCLSH